ncbi:hypothetical protein CR205_08755 [Alteribacter lacisalsi]|uniref:DUF4190 domain-containing protein n=1 Tax=Alteribacter lacisalsi TaxID=2045244 RepID=A0A2W0HF73_9BACI|nr:DUF4190 domain-containing protein [Alteribacter lacisalsi]PYZ98650.1 hypothetical protein CR205_08755 [Alteribacter lacisalsi]
MDERKPRTDLRLVEEERDHGYYDRETDESHEYKEETSAEYVPNPGLAGSSFNEDTDDGEADFEDTDSRDDGKGMGAIGVALALVSLFFLPVILGAAAIVLGFITRAKGHAALGYTAIGIGAFSIIISLFMSPFF